MKKDEILKLLTLDEKIKWTSGNNMWTILGNEKLGIRELLLADGPHGVRVYQKKAGNQTLDVTELAKSTMFPSAAGMASTFNEELIYKVGETIGKECNMYGVDVLLAPGVNQKRSPLAGRNFEYYSEDPFLTGRMATNFINGVQSTGVGACIKHYALNEQENQRRFLDTVTDERTLHELYLKPFKMAIDEANPMMIMSAYNKVNGHYASESKELLINILRDKWNYEGTVVSDWGAVQDKVKSLRNGMNIEMPGPSEHFDDVYEALNNGTLTEADIDKSLSPLLDLYERVTKNNQKDKKTDLQENHHIARSVSEEAIVLLENDGILPLLDHKIQLGVIGSFAKNPRINGGGSATLKPYILENPLASLMERFDVHYAPGYQEEHTNAVLLQEVEDVCQKSDIILYFTGTTEKLETEGKEREHMNLPQGHIDVFEVIKKQGKQVITVLNNGGALNLTPITTSNAIIESWFLGGANGQALVDVLTGIVNPSGRLSETIPLCIEHTPFYPEFPIKTDQVQYTGDITRLGYRYYDTHHYPVRYPFGYGLSYTTFEYSNGNISSNMFRDDDVITITTTVTNTGNIEGKEVVQLYVQSIDSFYPRPKKELVGFKKVNLLPGASTDVTFTITKKDLEIYAVDFEEFRTEKGYYKLLVGKNVNDIVYDETVFYDTKLPIRKGFTLEHPLKNYFIYHKDQVQFLEERFHKFQWYEIEEPAIRVLKRLKRNYNVSDDEYQSIINKLKKI